MDEQKEYKGLYFDLFIHQLEKHYSQNNPQNAYADMKRFFIKHQFEHAQYSGYHSRQKMYDIDVFDLVDDMIKEHIWLPQCLNHFDVMNVRDNHNLMNIVGTAVDMRE